MTKVISFLGAPSSGKSTLTPFLYSEMKYRGMSVEFVQEYVKSYVYSGQKPTQFDQSYFFAKQVKLESLMYGKVDYIVVDSSIILPIIYEEHYHKTSIMKEALFKHLEKARIASVSHLNYYLKPSLVYNPQGRFEDVSEAQKIDKKIASFLEEHRLEYTTLQDNSRETALTLLEKLC